MYLLHHVAFLQDGLSLRALLREALGFSAEQARASFQLGVLVDGQTRFSNQPVRFGERVLIPLSPYASCEAVSGLPAVRVLYQDEALLAVSKPAMLQCHASPSAPRGSDTLTARVCAQLNTPAHPVHRLDAETTGIVIFARCPFVQQHLQHQMAEGSFQKHYLAWVVGIPSPKTAVIDAPIARAAPDSFTRTVCADGRRAVSHYRLLRTVDYSGTPLSLLELSPETGRTHQLRVHMTHVGCPLLGDTRYFTPDSQQISRALGLNGHQLCAVRVGFIHPVTQKPLQISCTPDFAFSPEAL